MVEKPFTIKDYDEQILQPAIKRFAECKVMDNLTRANILADYEFYGGKKPTRWQKFKYRLQDYRQRVKDIWTILKGGDIHEDCGY